VARKEPHQLVVRDSVYRRRGEADPHGVAMRADDLGTGGARLNLNEQGVSSRRASHWEGSRTASERCE
jgi:hypothetical protein